VFYGQWRIGYGGRRFRAWKFRTMVVNAEQQLEMHLANSPELRREWERDHKLRNDPRVTAIGRFLRKTSLDELPQLANVLIGQMSLVGPRPIVEEEIVKYGDAFRLYLRVRPGLTGLWQVSGRNDTGYAQRVRLDMHYVRNWSPWLDIHLLARTIGVIAGQKGAY
jgi:lipopolysaccharide/colanic/teichoic acid biosynthesis glycosyltransferase